MGFDNHSGLEHADAYSLRFRTLKGTEQGVLEEYRTHSATRVLDGENYVTAGMLGSETNSSFLPNCVARIEHQVGYDTSYLVMVRQYAG